MWPRSRACSRLGSNWQNGWSGWEGGGPGGRDRVAAQLCTHRDVIGTTLEGLRAQSEEFGQSQREELDVRAEAELRHAVGEYGDEEWQLVELESSGKLSGFDQELERLASEIQPLGEGP